MLTIRNLTLEPFSISRIERFEYPDTLQSKTRGYFFGANNGTSVSPSAPELGEHAQSFNHKDLNIALEPFESYTLSGPGNQKDGSGSIQSGSTVRLTIDSASSGRHRIDTNPSYTQRSIQKLTPLSPNPTQTFTALFHPSQPTPHLTIRTDSSIDYKTWMSTLPDTLPLSALSIPGTHNSHTYYRALPSVKCQCVDIKTQLENGIRFLDIRAQPAHARDPSKKDMYLVHGAFPISLTGPKYLSPILDTIYAFLAAHPSETILVSLKREGVGSSTDAHFARILQDHYLGPHASAWHTGTTIPYLGAVRGKCVLVRRYTTDTTTTTSNTAHYFSSSASQGLDATAWPHNTSSALFPHPPGNPTFHLQDFCEILIPAAIDTKVLVANDHLVRAAGVRHPIPGLTTDRRNPVPPGPVFLNFLSGSHFWKRACWPERVAGVVNARIEEWVCEGHYLEVVVEGSGVSSEVDNNSSNDGDGGGGGGEVESGGLRKRGQGDGGTGIVVMDFVGEGGDWEFVRLVVGMNGGVLMRVREMEMQMEMESKR